MRTGLTIPFEGFSLRELPALVQRAEAAGYESVWSAEATGFDGFTPLAVAALHSERMRLVSGIVNVDITPPQISGDNAALVEGSCGRMVYGLRQNDHRPPASIAKIVTALVAAEQAQADETKLQFVLHSPRFNFSIYELR